MSCGENKTTPPHTSVGGKERHRERRICLLLILACHTAYVDQHDFHGDLFLRCPNLAQHELLDGIQWKRGFCNDLGIDQSMSEYDQMHKNLLWTKIICPDPYLMNSRGRFANYESAQVDKRGKSWHLQL